MTWLAILAFGKRIGSGVMAWLSSLSFWQLVCLALGIFAFVQHFEIIAARHDAAKWESQLKREVASNEAAVAKAKQIDKVNVQLSAIIKEQADEESRRTAGDAQSLRVSGPGRAVCPAASAAASGHEQAAPVPDAAGPALPPADGQDLLAAVPWGWLTDRGGEHDQAIIENKAWRDWYRQLVANWPK